MIARPFAYGSERAGWRPVKFRQLLYRRQDFGRPDLPLLSVSLDKGVTLRRSNPIGQVAASSDLSTYQVVMKNDLVMNRLGKPHGALGVSGYNGIISPAYFVCAMGSGVHPRFMHFLVRTRLYISEYERRGKWMPPSQFDISWEQFREIEALIPPMDEQRTIADFLDRETARIDALIEKKRLLAVRVERRYWLAFVHRVRSGGFPQIQLRRAFQSVTDGPFGSAFSSDDYVDQGAFVVRLGNIGFAEFKPEPAVFIPLEMYPNFIRHRVDEGNLLIAALGDDRNHAGRACVAPNLGLAIVKGKCLSARVDKTRGNAEYLALLLSSPLGAETISTETRGSTRSMINLEIIKQLALPLPGVKEQESIAREFSARRSSLDALLRQLQKQIALLEERRQALITAAVTGQLDVSSAA